MTNEESIVVATEEIIAARLVWYFDVFNHPLTLDELGRLMGCDVTPVVDQLASTKRLERQGPYVFAPGRVAGVERREHRGRVAEANWRHAHWASRRLAQIPWVRGILITGGMSKNSAEEGDDVDFLLLVSPGRVWTLKSTLQLMRKGLPPSLRRLFCTNYILDTEHLEIDDKNIFTAVELATAVPMMGPATCTDFLQANAWAQHYIPGYPWAIQRARNALPLPASKTRTLTEGVGLPHRLEHWSRQAWSGYWDHKYKWLTDEVRAQRFKRRQEIATNHLHDFQAYVLDQVQERWVAAGIADG